MVNISTTVNRIVLHVLQRNITHLDVITRRTNIKFVILKGKVKLEKKKTFLKHFFVNFLKNFLKPASKCSAIAEYKNGNSQPKNYSSKLSDMILQS